MQWLVGAVAAILSWLGTKAAETAKKFAMFSVLVGINSALLVAFVAYVALVVELIIWLFGKFNDLINYINAPAADSILSHSLQILKASGAFDGAADGFSAVSVGLISLLVAFLTRLVIKLLLHFRFTVFSLILSIK